MRILFAGSPAIAVPSLTMLASSCQVVAVLTNPASRQGRGLVVEPTPVAIEAARLGLPVLAPERLGQAERDAVAALDPDLLVVFAYGRIFGPKFMALFPRGGINAHPSLLPRWRGPSPIPYAILAGDQTTGVSIQTIAPRMDAGDIVAVRTLPLDGTETTASLGDVSAVVGAELLRDVVTGLEAGTIVPAAQNEDMATYSRVLSKDDGLIDWTRPAAETGAMIRAYYPWPLAWTGLHETRLSILAAEVIPDRESGQEAGTVVSVDKSGGIMVQTGKGLLGIQRLQLRGKKAMDHGAFANGARDLVGARLATPACQPGSRQ